MKRIKLKKRKQHLTKFNKIIIILILIITLSLFSIKKLGELINDKIMDFAIIEVNKLSRNIINKAVNETVLKELETDKLFIIEKNSKGDIQLIDFDALYVNKILSLITENIEKYFYELESGYSSIIDIKSSLVTNTDITSKKKGVIFEIPIGVATKNPIFSNVGPKIPIKLSLSGDLESCVKTMTQSYGINNSVITVYVNIKVNEQVLLPLSTKRNTVSNDIPIAIKVIQGNIPNYYFNGVESNSSLYNMPTN